MNELLHTALSIAGIVSGIVVMLRGFEANRQMMLTALATQNAAIMNAITERTVSLPEYKAFVRERHAAENSEREKRLLLERDVVELKRAEAELRAELRVLREVSRGELGGGVTVVKP